MSFHLPFTRTSVRTSLGVLPVSHCNCPWVTVVTGLRCDCPGTVPAVGACCRWLAGSPAPALWYFSIPQEMVGRWKTGAGGGAASIEYGLLDALLAAAAASFQQQ